MYQVIPQSIPQNRRAEINEKILFSIDTGKELVTPETIYNCYTGIGGLHHLKQDDYPSYHEYAQAKKEIEMGQFFTPHEVCRQMVGAIAPEPNELVLDMCCGMGNFFNYLPNQYNAYGFDIDRNAVKVARHLYPHANIQTADICAYTPEVKFDIVIGNPPFNLYFDGTLSQFYYTNKAYWMLNPTGLLMMIVPCSFLQSDFWDKSKIKAINDDFSFIGQTKLDANAFASVGVHNFDTKVMAFMRFSHHITMQPYTPEEFVPMDELKERIAAAREIRKNLKLKLHQESSAEAKAEEEAFKYRLKKYLFELKAHSHLQKHYDKAIALVTKFYNQQPPVNCTSEERKAWEKNKLTYGKVLSVIHGYIKRQNIIPRKEIALVKTNYGFRLKGYAPRLLDGVKQKYVLLNQVIIGKSGLPVPPEMTPVLQKQYAAAQKFIARKKQDYELQSRKTLEMERQPELDAKISSLSFYNKQMEVCHFTPLQQHDMGLIFQKRYNLLNWQQGSGKTAVAYYYGKHVYEQRLVKNIIVLAPAIAIHLTWAPFLERHNEKFIIATRPEHLENVPGDTFVLVALTMLNDLKKAFKRFLKMRSQKVCLLFDESDEITNPATKRTKLTLCLFRRLRYKLLTTGTTTRNNIGELYSQIELMYNNSVNMICYAGNIYYENREREIETEQNPHYFEPFPARGGSTLFKSCFCPGKATVFGIEKHNQDIYNQTCLAELIDKTIITRKFKEFAGDKYEIITRTVKPSDGEREVYKTILEKFHEILHLYFNPMKDTRKESQLRLVRQIMLLIKACSVPQSMKGYYGEKYPRKARQIGTMLNYEMHGKVAIGCTSLDAVGMYREYLSAKFPDRPLFVIKGNVDFKKRQHILDKFEKTENGILVCTQQSLKSSANVPSCEDIIIESLQWNIPRMEQFYFRFIRLDSEGKRHVHFLTYEDSIEQNLMALVLTKERVNEFIKSGAVKEESEIFEEFDISPDIIYTLFRREQDDEGHFHIQWGQQQVS
ncbi:N-6 DNA methylase [Bacteroides fragilis]|uniref:N-6 DNA methylase n=1 Tax=Bacteroides fragilis TaxID=817 RepID=UPI00189E66D7|nr:N-6 DNA methylase [Bacteroides fragilis]